MFRETPDRNRAELEALNETTIWQFHSWLGLIRLYMASFPNGLTRSGYGEGRNGLCSHKLQISAILPSCDAFILARMGHFWRMDIERFPERGLLKRGELDLRVFCIIYIVALLIFALVLIYS
jgi:hypothetical protein